MSDTDDGFDEEAVREELREKYADDDRGETERMSELLLQGATMTNEHCDRCGNPIFRYEGRAFCPNCQQAAEQQAAQEQPAEQADARVQADRQPAERQQSADRQSADQQPAGQQPSQSAERRQSPPARDQRPAQSAPTEQPAAESAQPPAESEPATPAQSGEGADALDASIAALARRAAGADDPRRAREFLEAAREGAEALAALRRNA